MHASILPELPEELQAAAAFESRFPPGTDYSITSDEGKAAMVVWWLINVKRNVGLDRRFKHYLEQPAVSPARLTRLEKLLWQYRRDLQEAFDLDEERGRVEFKNWVKYHSDGEVAAIESISRPVVPQSKRYRRQGVNLIGMVNAETGIGEDIRMMARCLDQAGVEYCLYNYPGDSVARQRDDSFADRVVARPVSTTSIFCLPGEHIHRAFYELGAAFFYDHYVVAYSPWELPYWPESLVAMTGLVDEFWCATRFVQHAVEEVAPAKTCLMPMAVAIEDAAPDRAGFGWEAGEFVFLYIFDGLSHAERKNPLTAIEAFKRAFPREREKVRLVIKTMNLDRLSPKFYADIRQLMSGDSRIAIVDRVWDRRRILQLYRSADAYVSLHRSEGFGRTIAEAMLSGLPVIVSAFSGNLDYCKSDNCYLVGGSTLEVGDAYPLADDRQFWFDPDVDEATAAMRRCYGDHAGRRQRAAAAMREMNRFSIDAISKSYHQKITGIIDHLPEYSSKKSLGPKARHAQ